MTQPAIALGAAPVARPPEPRDEVATLRLLLDGITDHAIFALDPAGRVASWNRGAERLLGYRAHDAIGQHMARFHLPQEVQEGSVAHALEQALLHGRHAEEGLRVRQDGSTFWAHCVVTPLRDAAGNACGYAAVLRDVSERKRREEALQRLADASAALRARDEFLSLASHELRTPLTALRMHLQTLSRAARRRPQQAVATLAARAAKLEHHVDRMSALIDNLLEVARIASGHLDLELAPLDLGAMITRLVGHKQEALPEGPAFRVSLSEGVRALGDERRLEQAIAALLDNAVKYGRGEPVDVALGEERGRALLVIRDRGIGIAPSDQERVFERFERAASVKHYGGFGFGLWAAREIVKAHGGDIRIHSHHGDGSTFVVELPARRHP